MPKITIPITKPTLEPFSSYAPAFRSIIESGIITNGPTVRKFEEKAAKYLGVKRCVAVSSCTSGLMLVMKGLGLSGEVIMPSFTFSASGHAVRWNGLTPIFADIDPDTYELDAQQVEQLITPKTSAIFATHIFGTVCNVPALEKIARKHKLKLIFDGAHAFGASRNQKKAGGFGDAEVFSCSPTKLMTTGEGGVIATNNTKLADFCRIGRNYGDDGSYDTAFHGLNARMSEFHAAVGLRSLAKLDSNLKRRNAMAAYYMKKLRAIDPQIGFQQIDPSVRTTYKDFSLYIDPDRLGYTRDQLCNFLAAQGITAKKYFYPPLHLQKAYAPWRSQDKRLPITNTIATRVLSLPLYSHISKQEVDTVIAAIRAFTHDQKRR